MKINKIYLIIVFFSLVSSAQISKGNWMMGGAADFSHYKSSDYSGDTKGTTIALAPNVGYFFIDKLAIGTSVDLFFIFPDKKANHTYDSSYFNYGIAPFVRYYFLEKEKTLNIFSEMSYGFSTINKKTDQKIENFKVKVGAAYFLNSSVGLEVALNYLNNKYINSTYHEYDGTNNSIFLGVGFQIHLEKD